MTQTLQDQLKKFYKMGDNSYHQIEGLDSLNNALGGGFSTETLNIIVARSGMGKTNLLIYLATRLALLKAKVIFVSCELSVTKLIPRMLASLADIPINEIKKIQQGDEQLYSDLEQLVKDLQIKISYSKNINDIYQEVCFDNQNEGYDFIFIDHYQELEYPDNFKNEYDGQNYIINILEKMYKQNGMTIFMANQFKKSNFTESEDLTQDDMYGNSKLAKRASNILHLYETKEMAEKRQVSWKNLTYESEARIKLIKAREGQNGYKYDLIYARDRAIFRTLNEKKLNYVKNILHI